MLLIYCGFSYGQTVLSGIVLDEQGSGLPGANVYLENTFEGTSTDGKGTFSFETAEQGDHVLRIEFVGFEGQAIHVQVAGPEITHRIVMKEAFSRLEAVTITAGAFEAGDKQRSPALTSMDVVTTAGAMADIAAALQSLPGTTQVGESGRLFVRGGDATETNTYIDGLWVPTPYFSNLPNVSSRGRFNPFLFDGTIFSTGGYSAEYGQALSSVLLLNTSEVKREDQLNLSFLSVGGDFSGTKTWENQSITASGNFFNLAPYLEVIKPNQKFVNPPFSTGNEISYKLKTGKYGIVKGYSNFNHAHSAIQRVNLDAGGTSVYDLTNSNYYSNLSWRGQLDEKWHLMAGGDFQADWNKVGIDTARYRSHLQGRHGKLVADYDHSEKMAVRFGGEYMNEALMQVAHQGDAGSQSRLSENFVAGFIEGNVYLSKKLVLRPGLRSEYSAILTKGNVAPRFSAAYKVGKEGQFSFATGRFYQKPLRENLLYSNQLDFQYADHFTLNYQVTSTDRIFRIESYFKEYAHLTRQVADSALSNTGKGYAYGLEVFYRDNKSIDNAHFWISYSFLESRRNYQDYPEMTTPSFAAAHSLSVAYKHWLPVPRMMLGSDFSISSRRRYHDPNMERFNAAKMPVYHNLNLNMAYLISDQKILYVAVSNVLGRKNHFGYEFASNPNSDGVYEKEKIRGFSDRFFVVGFFLTISRDNTINQLDKIN